MGRVKKLEAEQGAGTRMAICKETATANEYWLVDGSGTRKDCTADEYQAATLRVVLTHLPKT